LPQVTARPKIEPMQAFALPLLSDLPLLGETLFSQTPLTYCAFGMVFVGSFALYRTLLGLAFLAVGENPAAVEAQGISVTALRAVL
jgi:general nucleoside transport system permease protein